MQPTFQRYVRQIRIRFRASISLSPLSFILHKIRDQKKERKKHCKNQEEEEKFLALIYPFSDIFQINYSKQKSFNNEKKKEI